MKYITIFSILLLETFTRPATAFSPWLVRRLRRTVEVQRRQEEAAKAQAKRTTKTYKPVTLDKPDVHGLLEIWEKDRERLEHHNEHAVVE